MIDLRNITFEIDASTWPAGQAVPTQLVNAANVGSTTIDLNEALLRVGSLTQPPRVYGFSLSDCWAWLRYFPSFVGGLSSD